MTAGSSGEATDATRELTPEQYTNKFIQGDALTVLRTLPDGIADICVTSPPYWSLRDYGVEGQIGLEATPDEYVKKLVDVFREVRRVLKPGRTLWLVLGDTYYSGAGRCRQAGGSAERHHPVGQPPNRRPSSSGLKPKDLVGIPWRVALALQNGGWWLRNAIVWHKPNALPSPIKDRLANSHEFVFVLANRENYQFNIDDIREPHATSTVKRVSGTRLSPSPVMPENRPLQPHRLPPPEGRLVLHPLGKNPGDVWSIAHACPRTGNHATFPPSLAERAIKAASKPGDLVLDPFSGTGTSLKVAQQLGRRWIGIDIHPSGQTKA